MFYEVEIVVKQTKGIPKKMDNLLQLQYSPSLFIQEKEITLARAKCPLFSLTMASNFSK